MSKIRCAIYTRKSSEEGLEQDFNSLDAQHEACAAYIKSQASEGWTQIRDRYDDGGISGGTLERPGLKQLMADIAAGRIDIVVVYKVDRLTRSLLDFSKLVEAFDKAGASFVSVTQSFNTTTSMGRLTLNMLLSFAQFEREVTAERIRDKIAQSKARGMWMGGTPPIGYRPDGRSLAIVEDDAVIVRHIFTRYAELANVRLLAEELEGSGIRSPARTSGSGRAFGGCPFSRGQLYKLLSNPAYIARIDHGGRSHQANHSPIIDQPLWDEAQAALAGNINGTRRPAPPQASLLAGKLVDDRGVPMVAVHACKGNVRYRYYVSRDLQHSGDARTADGWRLPAREIEPLVVAKLVELLRDPAGLISSDPAFTPTADQFGTMLAKGKIAADQFGTGGPQIHRIVRDFVSEVRLSTDNVELTLDAVALAKLLDLPVVSAPLKSSIAISLKRSGAVLKLVTPSGTAAHFSVDRTLINAIARGRKWWQELQDDPELTLERIGQREGITGSYVIRIVRLAFLAPDIIASIIDGNAPVHVTVDRLTAPDAISARWSDQRQSLGMLSRA